MSEEQESHDALARLHVDLMLERDELEEQVERLREEARNRKHYSDNPRTTLHSWEEGEPLREVGGTCSLCDAIRDTL